MYLHSVSRYTIPIMQPCNFRGIKQWTPSPYPRLSCRWMEPLGSSCISGHARRRELKRPAQPGARSSGVTLPGMKDMRLVMWRPAASLIDRPTFGRPTGAAGAWYSGGGPMEPACDGW